MKSAIVHIHSVQLRSTISTWDDDDFYSPVPSLASSPSSVSSSSSSEFSFACQTPEHMRTPEVQVIGSDCANSDPEDDKNGDYLPFDDPPIRRRLFRTTQQSMKPKRYAEPLQATATKRKAMHRTVCPVLITNVLSLTPCRSGTFSPQAPEVRSRRNL